MAFMSALEYGVEHKLIFGSDFPSATPAQVIAGQWKVNDVVRNTSLPEFPEEAIHNMIYENWKPFLREAQKNRGDLYGRPCPVTVRVMRGKPTGASAPRAGSAPGRFRRSPWSPAALHRN